MVEKVATGRTSFVYEVVVSATDLASNAAASDAYMLVIYDPSGDFVTGGGWIDSAADACVDFCDGTTGKGWVAYGNGFKVRPAHRL